MKYPQLTLVLGLGASLVGAAFAATPNRSSSPIIIPRPAIPDGSVQSRAPFPAERPFDDVKRPDGIAIDNTIPPNTPATTPEPLPAPAPKFAILVPANPAAAGMTGPSGSVAAPLDAARTTPALQAATIATREETISDIETRMRTSDTAIAVMKRSVDQMSPSGRSQFHAANAEVAEREKALRKSIRAARDANETDWESARRQLASDFAAYADALARIDDAAGITPAVVR
jgi:hypothetical protein